MMSLLPKNTKIGHAHLQVSDLQRALAFYGDLVGFQINGRQDATAWLSATGELPPQLILTAINPARQRQPNTTGLYHVAIRFPDRIALSRVFRRLLEYRTPFHGAADHLVSEALYLPDPDGNGLELYADRPRQEWRLMEGQIAMSTDPLDLQNLLSASENDGNPWSGVDPATDIGHIHLQVSDLGKAEAFYSGLVGLDVTQRSYPGALFLSAGGYHHHLGVNIWAGRGAPPSPADAVGLYAFKLDIPDETARQEVLRRLREAEIKVEDWSINGKISGSLVRDPDGIRLIL